MSRRRRVWKKRRRRNLEEWKRRMELEKERESEKMKRGMKEVNYRGWIDEEKGER